MGFSLPVSLTHIFCVDIEGKKRVYIAETQRILYFSTANLSWKKVNKTGISSTIAVLTLPGTQIRNND